MTEKEYLSLTNKQRRLPDQIRASIRKARRLVALAAEYAVLDDDLFAEFNGDLIAMERKHGSEALAGYSEGLVL